MVSDFDVLTSGYLRLQSTFPFDNFQDVPPKLLLNPGIYFRQYPVFK